MAGSYFLQFFNVSDVILLLTLLSRKVEEVLKL